MTSPQPLDSPKIPKDLDDLVESIFTKHKSSTSSADASVLPDWQQWWENDEEASFLLQSGINSIMSGAYSLAMKRVYDNASRKKQVLTQNFSTKPAFGTSTNDRFDEKFLHKDNRYSERARDQHRHKADDISGLRAVRIFPRNGRHGSFEGHQSRHQNHEQLDSVSRGRSPSVESSHRYDYHENRSRSNIDPFRTNAGRNDNDESGSYSDRHRDNRDVRLDAESIPVYSRHLDGSSRVTDGHSRGDDRSYRGDFVSGRREGSVDRYNDDSFSRYEHHGKSNYEKNRSNGDNLCYDHPRHSGSSLTSSQHKVYNHENANVRRSNWSTNDSHRLSSNDRRDSCTDRRKDHLDDHEHRKRHNRSHRPRSVDRAVRTVDRNGNDYRYKEKSEGFTDPVAAVPSVAIIRNDVVDQKSMKMDGKRETNNHSPPRSRKSRKSKRHRRSTNHDSSSSISGSTISSRGSSRRRHRRSNSSHRRRHSRHGESDEESLSSSTHRRSRRKRKSARHRHKRSDSNGIIDNKKSDHDRNTEIQKDASKNIISCKKKNTKDHDKDR